jgi:hypothetical protein
MIVREFTNYTEGCGTKGCGCLLVFVLFTLLSGTAFAMWVAS